MVVYVGWLQQTLSVCQAVICISLIGSIYSCVVIKICNHQSFFTTTDFVKICQLT